MKDGLPACFPTFSADVKLCKFTGSANSSTQRSLTEFSGADQEAVGGALDGLSNGHGRGFAANSLIDRFDLRDFEARA